MPIDVACSCGKKFRVADEHAGKRTRCPACRGTLVIPSEPAEEGLVPLEPPPEKPRVPPLAPRVQEEEPEGTYGVATPTAGQRPDGATVFRQLARFNLGRDSDAPTCLAISGDGRFGLVGVNADILVLDLQKSTRLLKYRGHDGRVCCLAVSPDGRLALSADERDDWIRLWEVETAREITQLDARIPVESLAFSPDGRLALSGGEDGTVLLWDVQTGREVDCLEGKMPAGARTVSFSPDGRLALAAGGEGKVRLWYVKNGRLFDRLKGASGGIATAAFSVDGKRVVAARERPHSKTGLAVWNWDVEKALKVPCFVDPTESLAKVSCVTVAPGGNWVLSGVVSKVSDSQGRDSSSTYLETGLLTAGVFGGAAGVVGHVVIGTVVGAVGRVVADASSATRGRNKKYSLQLWSVDTGHLFQTYDGHEGAVRCLAIAPNGHLALSGAEDGTVRAWGLPPPG